VGRKERKEKEKKGRKRKEGKDSFPLSFFLPFLSCEGMFLFISAVSMHRPVLVVPAAFSGFQSFVLRNF